MSMFTFGLVCLLDVDNTLLDNDRVTADLKRFLEREVDSVEHCGECGIVVEMWGSFFCG